MVPDNSKVFKLAYGSGYLDLKLDSNLLVDLIAPVEDPSVDNPTQLILQCLDAPLNNNKLNSFVGIKNVAIAVNDKTRPVPHDIILPPLLDYLARMGISKENIRLFIAKGTHKPMLADEFNKILPADIIQNYQVISHDCDDSSNLKYLA